MSVSDPLQHFDRQILLDTLQLPQLTHHPEFLHTDFPLLWLIANGHTTSTPEIYQLIAKLYHLTYLDHLPVKLNDSSSLANKVGSPTCAKYHFFPYLQGDELVIATADPFSLPQMLRHTHVFLPQPPKRTTIAICPLLTIRRHLLQSAYQLNADQAQSRLQTNRPHLSSHNALRPSLLLISILIIVTLSTTLLLFPSTTILVLFILFNLAYFALNPLKILVTSTGMFRKSPDIPHHQCQQLPNNHLPTYTLLIPLKNEVAVASNLIDHLRRIQYPSDKLDIKIITEVNDTKTQQSILDNLHQQHPGHPDTVIFDLIKVPLGSISTKPRSLNFAIQFATGDMCVIYDAEDRPDPYQLKKAYLTFLEHQLNTLCVQGKLNYYNPHQNLLTRFFTIEYSFWFDVLLPGLQAWRIPIPLGGTSNHFLTNNLRQIGLWDPYNITEDADLGWRLSRLGYQTAMMNSYTLEEANSRLWNWIKQRTRWQKGFLITLLVHLRTPRAMWRELGPWGTFSSIIIFTTNFFLPVINPLLWLVFLLWITSIFTNYNLLPFTIPSYLYLITTINLFFGNGAYLLTHLAGVIKSKKYELLPLVPLLPLYWFLISFASYRAIWQIFFAPFKWEKTQHGLK
jgi:cellulose synthase/poly-beta-1,6-N-acetylglucosamine synthase-like glycosyltransferase